MTSSLAILGPTVLIFILGSTSADAACATVLASDSSLCATCETGYYGTACDNFVGPLQEAWYVDTFEMIGCQVAILMFVIWFTASIYGWHNGTMSESIVVSDEDGQKEKEEKQEAANKEEEKTDEGNDTGNDKQREGTAEGVDEAEQNKDEQLGQTAEDGSNPQEAPKPFAAAESEDDDGEAGSANVAGQGDISRAAGKKEGGNPNEQTAEDGEAATPVKKSNNAGKPKPPPPSAQPKSNTTGANKEGKKEGDEKNTAAPTDSASTSNAQAGSQEAGKKNSSSDVPTEIRSGNEMEPSHDPDSPPRARSMTQRNPHQSAIISAMYSSAGKGEALGHDQVNKSNHAPPPPTSLTASAKGRSWMTSSASSGAPPSAMSGRPSVTAVNRPGSLAGAGRGMTESLSRPDDGADQQERGRSTSVARGLGGEPPARSASNGGSTVKRASSVKRKNLPPTRSVSASENAQGDNASSMTTRSKSVDPFATPFGGNNTSSALNTPRGNMNHQSNGRSISEPMMMGPAGAAATHSAQGTPVQQSLMPQYGGGQPYPVQPVHPYYYGPPPTAIYYGAVPPPQGYHTPHHQQQQAPTGGMEETMPYPGSQPNSQPASALNTPRPTNPAEKESQQQQQQPSSRSASYAEDVSPSSKANQNSIAKRATELSRTIPDQPVTNEVSPERKHPPPKQKFVEGDTLRRNHLHPEILCNFGGNVQEVLCGEQVVVTRALTEYVNDPVEGRVPITQYFVSGGDQACPFDIEPLFSLQGNALNGGGMVGGSGSSISRAKSNASANSRLSRSRPVTPPGEEYYDEPRVHFRDGSH